MIAQYAPRRDHSENEHLAELACRNKADVLNIYVLFGSIMRPLYRRQLTIKSALPICVHHMRTSPGQLIAELDWSATLAGWEGSCGTRR